MLFPYDIEDLSRLANVSKKTVYEYKKKNKALFTENSTKVKAEGKTKPKTMYSQAVLDLLLAQYGQGNDGTIVGASAGGNATELPSEPQKRDETPPEAAEDKSTITALQTKIEALEAQIEALEAERRELLKQNGNILLLLSQEKAEKALLLPAPKKSFGERIKALFHKDGSTN